MKAVILAGGSGSRLYPITVSVPKHLIPVLDKPALYYSLSLAIDLGADSFCVVTDPRYVTDTSLAMAAAVSNKLEWTIAVQRNPDGIVAAMLCAEHWLGSSPFLLLLSDNVFVGDVTVMPCTGPANGKAQSWLVSNPNPEQYGVYHHATARFYEKPSTWMGPWIATGLYAFPGDACALARNVKASGRGELEITDLLNLYADQDRIETSCLGAVSWYDIGTVSGLYQATQAVFAAQSCSGFLVSSPEVSLYRRSRQVPDLGASRYGQHVREDISNIARQE